MATIVLAENNEKIAQEYLRELSRVGEVIFQAKDCESLLEFFRRKSKERIYVDFLVLDSELPKLTGPEAIRQALEERVYPPESFLIALSSSEDMREKWERLDVPHSFYIKQTVRPVFNGVGEILTMILNYPLLRARYE